MKNKKANAKAQGKDGPAMSGMRKAYRVYVCIIYGIALVFTGFFTAPFSPYASTATKVYGMSISTINLATSLFSFACLVAGLPANVIIIKLGLRKTKLLANLLFLVGNCLKILVNKNVYFVHVGNFLAGLGGPMV
jgi:MFS family permease